MSLVDSKKTLICKQCISFSKPHEWSIYNTCEIFLLNDFSESSSSEECVLNCYRTHVNQIYHKIFCCLMITHSIVYKFIMGDSHCVSTLSVRVELRVELNAMESLYFHDNFSDNFCSSTTIKKVVYVSLLQDWYSLKQWVNQGVCSRQ